MKYTLIFFIVLLTGCTAVQVQQVDSAYRLDHVCIEDNPKVTVPNFVTTVENNFAKHLISTEVVSKPIPDHCTYKLTYTARRSWDIVTYLSSAELHLYNGTQEIGSAKYHLKGKGGFALTKWASVESKMNPVIDELLASYGSPSITP